MSAADPKRIVFVNQFYWPDNAPTAVLLDQVCRYAAQQGHQVTVICSRPGYVAGKAGDPPPVTICRVPSLPFARSPVVRLLSWGSFLVFASWRLFWMRRADVIVTMTTPPGLSIATALLRRRLGAKLWIWEMDVYPDVVVATGGLSPASALTRVLERIFTWSRRRADGVIALGECMKARLARAGVPESKIHIAENWADEPSSSTESGDSAVLRVLYSGNLGMAHEVDTVARVLTGLAGESNIRFQFSGGGAARPGLEAVCAGAAVSNVTFTGYGDGEQFAANLRAAHIGLVTLRAGCEGTVVPSKVYSLLAAGKPILFIGDPDATPAVVIRRHQCGWQFAPGEDGAIGALLRRLARDPGEIAAAGRRARRTFEEHYSRSRGTERVLRTLLAQTC